MPGFDADNGAGYAPCMGKTSNILAAALVAGLIYLGILGRLIELVLPVFIASAGRDLGLSNHTLGAMAGAELIGTVLFSLFLARRFAGMGARLLALIGVVALFAFNALSGFISNANLLVAVRFLAGLVGEGPLLVVAVTLLGRREGASRIYAIFMGSQMVVGGLALAALGVVDSLSGFRGVSVSMAILTIAGLISIPLLPHEQVAGEKDPLSGRLMRWDGASLLLIGMASFHIAVAAAWAFMQQKGASLGLGEAEGGGLLAIMLSGGLLGSLYVAILKTSRLWVLVSCVTLALSAAVALAASDTFIFAICGILIMVSWNIAVPHQIAQLSEDLGAKGRLALVPGAQGVGLAAGPVLAGVTSQPGEYLGTAWLVVISLAVALMCFWKGGFPIRGK